MRVLNFIIQNQEFVLGLLGLLITVLVRLTKWGKSNQDALIKVAEAIESIGDPQLKAEIAAKFETAPLAQKDAIEHVVSVVDAGKQPKTNYERILLDMSRLLLPKPKEGK